MGKTRKKIKLKKYLSAQVITALKTNDVSKLRSLKESGQSLSACDRLGNNLLHLAILEYSFENTSTIEAFEYLLTLDEIHKNDLNLEHYSPLMYAFGHSKDDPSYVIKLIESGCELSMFFSNGDTPLHLAVDNDWPDVVELLIEKGVDVDIQNEDKKTALHVAAALGHTDITWMLLFYGADPNVTYLSEASSYESYTYLTFFDIIYKDEVLFNRFSNFDKTFSLSTFIEAMRTGGEIFYKLMKVVCDINYDYDDLREFCFRFFVLDSKMLEIFVTEFGYIIEEVFQRCCLDELFFCPEPEPKMLQNFIDNLFTLLESDVVSTVVEELNNSVLPLLVRLVQSFEISKEQIELLMQILCGLLSHGVIMTPEAMNELYSCFGYCDLFKMMLQMNITETKRHATCQFIWPAVIYDIRVDIENVIYGTEYSAVTTHKLSKYFTPPAVHHLRAPSLTELARNASRKYIIEKYQPKNCMQFYTLLKRLPIAKEHERIISFERQLYS